jgi:Spy/CpxP family protein refolding chaperone
MSYLRNNKILLLIITALLVTNAGLLYFYVWKKKSRPTFISMKEHVMMRLENEVGFSKEQLAVYDSMRTKHFESMKPLFGELKAAKEEFFKLVSQPDVSDSLINAYATHVSEKQKAIDVRMLSYFLSLKRICTDEQKPKMDSLLLSITQRMTGSHRGGPGKDKHKK